MKLFFLFLLSFCFLQKEVTAQQYTADTGKASSVKITALGRYQAIGRISKATLNTRTGSLYCKAPVRGFDFGPPRIFYASTTLKHFFKGYLEAERYPDVVYEGNIVNLKEVNFLRKGRYAVMSKGILLAHGKAIPKEIPLVVTVKDGSIDIEASFSIFPIEEFGIRADTGPKKTIFKMVDVNLMAALKPLQ